MKLLPDWFNVNAVGEFEFQFTDSKIDNQMFFVCNTVHVYCAMIVLLERFSAGEWCTLP